MIAVLSPAKTLDLSSPLPPIEATEPRFGAEAATLAAAAARLGPGKLKRLMHISPKLARLNIDRFRGFTDQEERPAIHSFAGDVYTGFEVRSLDDPAIDYAQDHVRVLSGLYGLLRPLDRIRPYRLEMGTRWAPRRKSLTAWWGNRIADALAEDVAQEGSGLVLNLASKEYWSAVEGRLPAGIRVITADFREAGPDGPRFITVFGKRARGMMARWMVEHRITDADALRGFDSDGYAFDADMSSEDHWFFMRG